MATRHWNIHNQDWDPMRDDYNNTTYDAQYPDDNTGGGVHLDQCRLYITNIPKNLTQDGLKNAFAKYGTLVEAFLSKDMQKRYGLVSYETSGEAKLALMKLNRTEPLNLNISIAHKKKNERKSKDVNDGTYTQVSREDSGSQCSRGRNRKQEDLQIISNGDGELDDLMVNDDLGLMENLDVEVHKELVQLKMEQLKVREAQVQCKQRMLLLNRMGMKPVSQIESDRCILPGGRIVVRNDRASDTLGTENFGNGDALRPPALQRAGSRLCVSCGSRAESFCARCEVTPYCSARCQKKDWNERHRSVCHNLARPANAELKEAASHALDLNLVDNIIPPPAPLRRPHSPANRNAKREDGVDKQKVYPAGNASRTSNQGNQQNNNHSRAPFNNKNRTTDNKPQIRNQDKQQNRPYNRAKQAQGNQPKVEEEWTMDDDTPTEAPKQIPPMRKPHDVPKAEPRPKFESKPKDVPKVDEPKSSFKSKPEEPKSEAKITKLLPASVESVTPVKKIVPKNCVAELLSIGDVAMLSVDASASDCRAGNAGFVCLALNEMYGGDYEALCDAYAAACESVEAIKPSPGQPFSYLDPSDGGWYRARCLTPALCALLDAGRVVTLKPEDSLKILPQVYAKKPEFCCLLKANGVKIGDNLKCTVTSKLPECSKVSIENAETGAVMGEGEISRWLPEVEVPVPAPIGGVAVAEVPRPDLTNGSKVLLVEATDPKRALVRGADSNSQRRYDSALHGALLYGQGATPLNTPPQRGQVVIGKFSDGLHYRALCKRTNVKQNKYLLEYVEFGNTEIAKLEDIYPCPPEFDLQALPAEASVISLKCNVTAFTGPAKEYIERLKDSDVELVLSLTSGAKSEPSGAEALLTVADTKESVNGKLEEMSTPEWKKMERKGADVVESPTLMYSSLDYLELPPEGCEIEVLDISSLEGATVSGYKKGEPLAKVILEDLPKQLQAYCNSELGKEPYLPKFEELCIAQCPPYPQWFRAVLCEQVSGAGGKQGRVCFIDYGNVECVDVKSLRKMMPEFIEGKPALAAHLEIRDFPKDPTEQMLTKALLHMNVNEEGRGHLKVTQCQKIEQGLYIVDAPELIRAMIS